MMVEPSGIDALGSGSADTISRAASGVAGRDAGRYGLGDSTRRTRGLHSPER